MKKNSIICLLVCFIFMSANSSIYYTNMFYPDRPLTGVPVRPEGFYGPLPKTARTHQFTPNLCKPRTSHSLRIRPTAITEVATSKTPVYKQRITVHNRTFIPASIDVMMDTNKHAGFFGYAVPIKTTIKLTIPEFYWFEFMGRGFRKPNDQPDAGLLHVLKHVFANKLIIHIPDCEPKHFSIEPYKSYIVEIMVDNSGIVTADLKEQ